MKTKNASVLGQWLWLLFWLIIPRILSGILTLPILSPATHLIGGILGFLCSIAYAAILLRLASESPYYRPAGIFFLVYAVVEILEQLPIAFSPVLAILLSLVSVVIALYAENREYRGHSDVVLPFDRELSLKWDNLWKWYLYTNIALIAGVLITMLIHPALGEVLTFLFALILSAIAIMKLVYLYREAKLFRSFTEAGPTDGNPPSENISPEF